MEEQKDTAGLLDLVIHPAFCVKDQTIVKTNQAAQQIFLQAGMEVLPLLLTGAEEYQNFTGGCLYLTLSIAGQPWGAAVQKAGDQEVFLLEDSEQRELRAMALAAKELREPLSGIMATADTIMNTTVDDQTRQQLSHLNRGLFQLLRIIGNMSDADRYAANFHPQTHEIGSVFSEIFEKLGVLADHAGIRLTYQGLPESIYCLADVSQLERAVYNIISNAIKFTPKDGTIDASLTRHGRVLRLSVQDSGSGIAEGIRSSVFSRYLRQPAIEDSRFGIGLGMTLIRSAAAQHGGAILIDQPEGAGTRVTMTMAIRQNTDNILRSPILQVDYTGGFDHGLVELSDCLPADFYDGTK